MSAVPAAPRIGWIGLGLMGAPMAGRVLDAGLPVTLWARRPEAADPLVARGADRSDTPADLAARSDIVVTMVGGPADVEALHTQTMPAARPGTLFVDFTTAAPSTGTTATQRARALGLRSLESPVTGGVAGAQQGTLTLFVAGDDAGAAHDAGPLLQAVGRAVACGGAGQGYRTKLLNQTMMAGALMGVADGARMARAAGVDGGFLRAALAQGSARSAIFENYVERMLGPGGAVGFHLGLLLKDLRLARAEAHALGVQAPLLDAAVAAVARAVERHGADAGVQWLAAH